MRFFGKPVPEQKGEFDKLIESIEQKVALEHIGKMVELLEAAEFATDYHDARADQDEDSLRSIQRRIRSLLTKLDDETKAELIKHTKLKD